VRPAERCRSLIAREAIPHEKSPISDMLTASAGVGTTIPTQHAESLDFIEQVDRRLYRAKQAARNCIVDSN